ncbi:MAG: FAD-binding oxidoreductase, partial [Phycisphaeraceae bacterium]
AIWYPQSAFCNPHAFVMAAAELARLGGAEIVEGAPVSRLIVCEGKAVGVETEDGRTIEGDAVVLAAGSWTPALARQAGVRLLMQPAKGYHRDVAMEGAELRTACIFGEANMVCTPMDGFVRLAGTLEFSGMNGAVRPRRLEMLSEQAGRYLASRVVGPARSEWMGLRPCTPDGLPAIGWAPNVGGVFIATGHAMLGLSQGPATGEIVAECVVEGGTDIDLAPMRPDRF